MFCLLTQSTIKDPTIDIYDSKISFLWRNNNNNYLLSVLLVIFYYYIIIA